ncbi:MAG: hypothetical protein WC650_04465 [Candidatus Doudnabacteria bacterium]
MPKIKKNIQLITLLLIPIVWVVIFSGCIIQKNNNQELPLPNPASNPNPAGEAEWQTYQDPQNLFFIRVPSNFTLISDTQSGVTHKVTFEVPNSCPEDIIEGYCFPQIITIKYLYNQGGLTAEEWFSEAGKNFEVTGNQEIAGYEALVAIPSETEGYATRYVFTAGNLLPNNTRQYIFDLSVSSGIEDFLRDQILATFQIIPSE